MIVTGKASELEKIAVKTAFRLIVVYRAKKLTSTNRKFASRKFID